MLSCLKRLTVFSIFVLAVACTPAGGNRSSHLHVVAPNDIPKLEILRWTSAYQEKTGNSLEVETIPLAQYRDRIWAELLSGADRWDAVLVDGKWLEELLRYRAIMRIANYGFATNRLIMDTPQESGGIAITSRLDIPILVTRKGDRKERFSENVSFIRLVTEDQIKLGFTAVNIGSWLMRPRGSGSHDLLISPTSLEFPLLSDALCRTETSWIDPRSVSFQPEELIEAVAKGEIDAGVLWTSQFEQVEPCGDAARTGCTSLVEIDVAPLYTARTPMLLTAWVIPVHTKQAEDALAFLKTISTEQVYIQGVSQKQEQNSKLLDDVISVAADGESTWIREDLGVNLDNLILRCLTGEIGSEQFSINYLQVYQLARSDTE
jgi:hypothetical protein